MYGLIISFSIGLCLFLGERLAKKVNIFWGSAFWSIAGGMLGARIYHVAHFWRYYQDNPFLIFSVHRGGLGILGGIIGGLIFLIIYLKIKKENILLWLDLAAVFMPLGQAIGRLGNFFNQELFGKPTNLPWGIFIPRSKRPIEFINNDIYHPLFAYELILNLLLFTLLYLAYNVRARPENKTGVQHFIFFDGIFLSSYIIGYGLIRYFIEFLKIDPWVIKNINMAQFFSILFILSGLILLIKKGLNKKI